jgi:GH24 family phage-related lysozyme (muramidase)
MNVVTVRVPQNLTLEQAQRVVASVVAKCGHNTCFSGFDIRFTNAVDYAVQANTLEVREIG